MQDCSTDFEFLPYDVSLARCRRYYQRLMSGSGPADSSTSARAFLTHTLPMRSAPSLEQTGVLYTTDGYSADFVQSSTNLSIITTTNENSFAIYANFTGLTTGRIYFYNRNLNSNVIFASSEL